MTSQYLAGELSLQLARVCAVADPASVETLVNLRRLTETVPVSDLGGIAVQALVLLDTLCWRSLESGDGVAFAQQAAAGAELQEFGRR